jgi:hypothetical protein
MSKDKSARRMRLMEREREVAELVAELKMWKKSMLSGSAFRLAVMRALKEMPAAKVSVIGGNVRVGGESFGPWLAAEIERQYGRIIEPPKVETGEVDIPTMEQVIGVGKGE